MSYCLSFYFPPYLSLFSCYLVALLASHPNSTLPLDVQSGNNISTSVYRIIHLNIWLIYFACLKLTNSTARGPGWILFNCSPIGITHLTPYVERKQRSDVAHRDTGQTESESTPQSLQLANK